MWAQLINIALGLWIMAAPQVFGYAGAARTNDWIVGPLAATFACIALWEATRSVRWWNLPLAIWLVVAPVWLGFPQLPFMHSIAAGVLMGVMSCLGGRTRKSFGGGWPALWRSEMLAQSSSSSTS
jgi:hypothetical protein